MTTNRNADATDAAYWPEVNEGDYIYFSPNNSSSGIYSHPNVNPITVGLGKKILIFAGEYTRISIGGEGCTNTRSQPTVITNFGGQVRIVGDPQQYRGLSLNAFVNLHVTGKYDPVAQTGNANFLGHNDGNDFDTGDFYDNYGIVVDMRWADERSGSGHDNLVRIQDFEYCKIDYVSAYGGGFAAFNLKNDYAYSSTGTVEVDAQDCFAGWTTSEGFYIGKFAADLDFTKLTLKNNIVAFCGSEGMQTDSLLDGSVIENNIVFGSAMDYRAPFQSYYQEGMQQVSFVEGGITIRDNIMFGGQGAMQHLRYLDSQGRVTPVASKKLVYDNNYLGTGRSLATYIFQGDGITPYELTNSIWGPLDVPGSNDAYTDVETASSFIAVGATSNPVLLEDNMFDPVLPQWNYTFNGGTNVTEVDNTWGLAPVLKFVNSGFPDDFDPRRVSIWTPTFTTTGSTGRNGDYVTYNEGDIVIYYEETGSEAGMTKMYVCLETYTGDANNLNNPATTPSKWQQLTWNGSDLPPLDLRFMADTTYNYRGMGTEYNETNLNSPDLERPVITLTDPVVSVVINTSYSEPGYSATDNVDGTLTSSVTTHWVGEPLNTDQLGEYILAYDVTDAAGNRAITKLRRIYVSEPNITYGVTSKVNIHKNSPVNLSGWTDMNLQYNGNPTTADLKDTNDNALSWDLLIENINNGYSEHSQIYTNSAGRTIGDFPASVTRQGVKIRDPYENPCVLRFTNLDPYKFYEVKFTGYKEGSPGQMEATLYNSVTEEGDTILVQDNSDQVGYIRNAQTDISGQMDIVFTTVTPRGYPNLAGVIVTEKSGYGLPATYTGVQSPYGGTAHGIPGLIQAEDYDVGGQNSAYYDATAGNTPNKYRTDDVDVSTCGDTGGGYMVGWISDNEWLEYTVYVSTSGYYDLDLRLAQNSYTPKALDVSVDGALWASVPTTYSGGWSTFTTFSSDNLYLSAGTHVLRMTLDSGYNFNWFQITAH